MERVRVFIAGDWGSLISQAAQIAAWEDERVELVGIELDRLDKDRLIAAKPDILISAAHRYLLPEEVLATPSIGSVGLHPSLLPKYRGSYPLWWALRHNEPETGVSLFKLEAGIDTGPILGQEHVEIRDGDSFASLYRRVAPLSIPLLRSLVDHVIVEGRLPRGVEQDESQASFVTEPTLVQRAIGRAVRPLRR